jgi:hypothetical protein
MVSVAVAGDAGQPEQRPGRRREATLGDPSREAASVALQVSGGKPLRLRGVLLAEGNSWAPGTVAWHEVALWRCEDSEVAVAVRTLRKAQGETDIHRAELFPNLADALGWLEEFDPTADLSVDLDASDRALSAIEIALRAAALRGRADEVARQWRALLGEMLFRLDPGA